MPKGLEEACNNVYIIRNQVAYSSSFISVSSSQDVDVWRETLLLSVSTCSMCKTKIAGALSYKKSDLRV
jgi:hypothetical protein